MIGQTTSWKWEELCSDAFPKVLILSSHAAAHASHHATASEKKRK